MPIYSLCANPMESLCSEAAQIMQKAMHEEHGTVAGLAALCQDLDDISMDNRKQFHASRAVGTHWSSLVHVRVPGQVVTDAYGEILKIFQGDWRMTWDDFSSLGVCLWELGEYQTQELHLPSLMDLNCIGNLLALTVVSIREDWCKVWVTVDLAKMHTMIKLIH
ncbi:hypothetical protein J3A83DRAFT_4185270 [Scleroderma citrinum]